MDGTRFSWRTAIRLSVTAAAVVLGMFAAYQLGMAGGTLVLLVVPAALVVFVLSALAGIWTEARGATPSEPTGWDQFDRELERARRHERPLALIRFASGPRGEVEDRPVIDEAHVRAAVRVLDAVWAERGHVFVAMPETDRTSLEGAVRRMLDQLPGVGADSIQVALYPDDGLTSGALIEHLGAPGGTTRWADIVQLTAPPSDSVQRTGTGG